MIGAPATAAHADPGLEAFAFVRSHSGRIVDELRDFVQFPTVSAQPRHADDMHACAHWLARKLRDAGLQRVQLLRTGGPPLVYGEWLGAKSAPTVLIYGHYDVQPIEPIAAWTRAPFAGEMHGQYLYGRGSSDDKGQMFAHVKALEAVLHTRGRLGVNVRCLFEGEEEVGSPRLLTWMRTHARQLNADVAVVSDMRMRGIDRPAVTYALRGSLNLTIDVSRAGTELHAGQFGGVAVDPILGLCELLAGLLDEDNRVAADGFYTRVRSYGAAEREHMRLSGPADHELAHEIATPVVVGEPGFSAYERATIRPCLTVTGISGGYAGHGHKSSNATHAYAKVNVRLVPFQEPKVIENLLRHHLQKRGRAGLRIRVSAAGHSHPFSMDRDHPLLLFVAACYAKAFGVRPVLLRSGGTVPIVGQLHHLLGVPVAAMGFALPSDRMHAADERMHIPGFFRGIDTCIHFLEGVGSQPFESPQRTSNSSQWSEQ